MAAIVTAAALGLSFGHAAQAFESGRAAFIVEVNDDLTIPYRVFAIYVLPGESVRFEAPADAATTDKGSLTPSGQGQWTFVAPADPGLARVEFRRGDERVRINALTMLPAGRVEGGRLNGYNIGEYPEPLRGNPVYTAPDGFIELTAELASVELSPHFRLDQFPSKQTTAMPKYLVLREFMLLKLELLLERVNEAGIETDGFTIMSGFRTPAYNRAIGNGQHSRHVYGGAADIFIDVAPVDNVMDDLNGDGVNDFRDAQWLYRIANELFGRAEDAHFRGGLGVYRATPAHGPFLHVDARGHRARWGLIP